MTAIKICGITTLADALAAAEAGADYLGFNFYAKSPRCVDAQACAKITAVVNAEHPSIQLVGVFVNASVLDILAILQACSLDLAQLHGDESPDMVKQLGPRAFKAFRGIPANPDGTIRNEPPACLIDASVKGTYGGTGITADWGAAARLAQKYQLFLAGGLTPENVAEAVNQVNPWGVDAASGVEVSPGVKDRVKMKDFVQAVHALPSTGSSPSTSSGNGKGNNGMEKQ